MPRTVLRMALLVALAVSVSGAAVGSSGFSAVEADRTVNVNVVENDEAYVGVVACEKANGNGADDGTAPVRVWVTNRYTEAITVASIASDDADRTNGNAAAGEVGVGDRGRFEPVFDAPPETITVEVTGDGFDASVTRTVTPRSECPHTTGNGNGAGSGGEGGDRSEAGGTDSDDEENEDDDGGDDNDGDDDGGDD